MVELPLILSLETATLGGSVFLGRGGARLAIRNGNPEVSQSSSLLSDINECLEEAGVSLREVNLFACALGPGSFTGLRIGIATLKALAASLQQPCIGIPTLRAVAYSAGASPRTVALLPAGRGEVFAQMFSVFQDGRVVELDGAAHLSPQRLVERYIAFESMTWAGSGAQLQRDFLRDQAEQNELLFWDSATDSNPTAAESVGPVWKLAAPQVNLASDVAALSLQLFQVGKTQSPQSLSAIYVRPSDAELNQQCR